MRLSLFSGPFSSGFPNNILYAFLFSPIRATKTDHNENFKCNFSFCLYATRKMLSWNMRINHLTFTDTSPVTERYIASVKFDDGHNETSGEQLISYTYIQQFWNCDPFCYGTFWFLPYLMKPLFCRRNLLSTWK
jgi:hypothetical protein